MVFFVGVLTWVVGVLLVLNVQPNQAFTPITSSHSRSHPSSTMSTTVSSTHTISRSPSQSITRSRRSTSLTITRSVSSSRSSSPSLSSKRSLSDSFDPTHTTMVSSTKPSITASNTARLTTSAVDSPTVTPPTPTRVQTPTFSYQPEYLVVASLLTPSVIDSATVTTVDYTMRLSLRYAAWRPETVAFIDQSMTGSQPGNPFGFDQQKEVLFTGVDVVPHSNSSALDIFFRNDPCFDPRGDETVQIHLDSMYVRSLVNPVLPPLAPITFRFVEDGNHLMRRRAGLGMAIVVCVCLFINAWLGNPGVSILLLAEFQLTNVIGRQSCSRGNVAAFFDDSFWVVSPTLYAKAFSDVDPQFGVVLVHFVVAISFFIAFVAVARIRKRLRMLFPSLPLSLVYVLFIGGTNSAWQSAVHGDDPRTAAGSMILWFFFFLAVAFTVWRIRSPRGLVFLRYHGGFLAPILRGTHSPLQLRSKYSLMIDCWHEDHVEFASPLHLTHLSISSIACAFSWYSTLGCFPVLGVQLAWQSIVFLMIALTRPGRSLFHNVLLIVHTAIPMLLITAEMVALDCLQNSKLTVSDVLTVIVFILYLLSVTVQIIVSVFERRYRQEAERELKDITAKHRRIVFFMDDVRGGPSGAALPPLAFHQINPKITDPDSRSRLRRQRYSFPYLKVDDEDDADKDGDAWSTKNRRFSVSRQDTQEEKRKAFGVVPVDRASSSLTSRPLPRGWTSSEWTDAGDEEMASVDAVPFAPASSRGGAHPNVSGTGPSLASTSPRHVSGSPLVQWMSVRARKQQSSPSMGSSSVDDMLQLNQNTFNGGRAPPPPASAAGVALTPLAAQLVFNAVSSSSHDPLRLSLPPVALRERSDSPPVRFSSYSSASNRGAFAAAERTTGSREQQERDLGLSHSPPPQPRSPNAGAVVKLTEHGSNRQESIGRCPRCHRWIALDEGCVVCQRGQH